MSASVAREGASSGSGFKPEVTPFLWFDNQAAEAVAFYVHVFAAAGKAAAQEQEKAGPAQVAAVNFELNGLKLVAFNGGPHFKFNEAISLSVSCESQEEIDYFWDALVEGGKESQCGWLKDRYGLSWQIVPKEIGRLMRSPAARAALCTMKKLDIAVLEKAAQS